MAQWARRGRRRRSRGWAMNMYFYSEVADDGAASGVGRPGCGDEVAPQSELASCAPVVLEEGDAPAGAADGTEVTE